MFLIISRSPMARRLIGIGGLLLFAPLVVTLSLLLGLETGRSPISRRQRCGRFRFRTRRHDGRRGPLGLAVERSGLHRLPALVGLIIGPPSAGQPVSLPALAPSDQEGYRRAV
jgi:hypothetical protein